MADEPDEAGYSHSRLTAYFMPRPRLDMILDKATRCKLVYVIAGAGYGKTQAVHHYIERQPNAVVRWLQLSENDNAGSHYWENLTHTMSFDNPALAGQLRELGFPDTLARFKQFADIIKNAEHSSRKTYLVLDDFHLIHAKEALTFAERCAYLQIPGACVIIISRKEPGINAVSLFAKGKASMITEDKLRFTPEETASFFRWRGIPFSPEDLMKYTDATKGWALAVKLLSLVLERSPQNIDHALDRMRENIFKLLEMEAWDDLTEAARKKIVRLSLLSDLSALPPHEIPDGAAFFQNIPALDSLVRFDSFAGDFKIHPLYLEFLQSKQSVLSDEEKRDIYLRTAQWCSESGFYMDAMNYYAKSRQFERMIQLFLSYPFKLPHDTCDYFLNIIEKIEPDSVEQSSHSFLLLKHMFTPLLLSGTGKYEEARERSFDTIHEWENSGRPFSSVLLWAAYSNLTYIDIYTCTVTHRYDSPKYLKLSVEYFKKSSLTPADSTGPFSVADIRSYACLVGEGAELAEFDQFLEAARETASYVAETFHGMYYGYDDLVACEISFFKNQTETAGNYAYRAILKAREKKQYSIEATAEQYLLRIAVQEGDYRLVKKLLAQLRSHLDNPDFWNRHLLFGLISGSFNAQIGLTEAVPPWFVMDGKETASESGLPMRELVISVRYYIARKKYNQALAALCKSYPREPQERFLFGELMLSLLFAVTRIHTGDTAGAMADFGKAYRMSFGGVFEMFFIELGKELRPLVAAALKEECSGIPEEWLNAIGRKASAYAKKAAVVANVFKNDHSANESVSLSIREREILLDVYHGLSREEIAENRYLSVNTIKKILQSVYTKLDANNNVDAIRIAIEKKLIE